MSGVPEAAVYDAARSGALYVGIPHGMWAVVSLRSALVADSRVMSRRMAAAKLTSVLCSTQCEIVANSSVGGVILLTESGAGANVIERGSR